MDPATSSEPAMTLFEGEYRTKRTRWGVSRRFVYPTGSRFTEFHTHAKILGIPLIHYTRGVCPDTGRRIMARGVIAIGRVAVGLVAMGQVAVGLLAVGQLALGLAFCLGQAAIGFVAAGQLAISPVLAVGQVAVAYAAIGQAGFGEYVLAQVGHGPHLWTQRVTEPGAEAFFTQLREAVRIWTGM